MPRKTDKLQLHEGYFEYLRTLIKQRTIQAQVVKPFKVKYYLEKRDPDFEQKMHDVLVIYKQVSLQFDEDGNIIVPADGIKTVTLSYDEKPGIQAIGNTCPDRNPTQKHGFVCRDSEYVRHGTLSLLAAIDLLTGEAIPLVSETHKSSDFVAFLKKLDKHYPKQDKIRIILDNHSAHTSKSYPTRSCLLHSPQHSWGIRTFIHTYTPCNCSTIRLQI